MRITAIYMEVKIKESKSYKNLETDVHKYNI